METCFQEISKVDKGKRILEDFEFRAAFTKAFTDRKNTPTFTAISMLKIRSKVCYHFGRVRVR
jgi:hypothetical protein